ncbi:STN and carboxypeptidase regulatory-like domain-containing protein [Jiulongibacter sp. NS-SX5]|uniref:STN and carboxypeptidase regulatory-like domain-containing protein n=1 Tax=Jiulongibacter sp. NS-SX5 TaxID=3463854 RepID=UPI0040585F87
MKKLLFLTLFLTSQFGAFGQQKQLQKIVSVNFENTPLSSALEEVEKLAGVNFSYNPRIADFNRKVSLRATNKSLSQILPVLLGPTLDFKVKGSHIILQKAPKRDFIISGYVLDEDNGEQIKNVSIYEPVTFASALTNDHGYYKIKLPVNQKDIDLKFSKEDYDIMVKTVFGRSDQKIDVNLAKTMKPKVLTAEVSEISRASGIIDSSAVVEVQLPEKPAPNPVPVPEIKEEEKQLKLDLSDEFAFIDTTYKKGKDQFLNWLMTTRQNFHFRNIQDSLYKPFQISLLPFLGTNLRLGPVVTNDISVNIFAGYTGSVRKVEVGGFANFIRKDLTGVQAAGAINVTGRSMSGVQAAGLGNFNIGRSSGVMAAGLLNFNVKDSRGIVASGLTNLSFGDQTGLMATGLSNFSFKNASGLHVAGLSNMTFGNHTGAQIGLFNYATKLDGTQIGLVNLAYERTDKSLPIGLFSYVHKNGYRRLEINASELNHTELTFKTGVPKFYTLFSAGFSYGKTNKPLGGIGLGLGTSWKYGRRFSSNFDVSNNIYYLEEEIEYLDQQLQASLGFEYKIVDRLAVFVAPTFNFYVNYDDTLDFSSYQLLLSERSNTWFGEAAKTYTWLGYKFGIRICNKG